MSTHDPFESLTIGRFRSIQCLATVPFITAGSAPSIDSAQQTLMQRPTSLSDPYLFPANRIEQLESREQLIKIVYLGGRSDGAFALLFNASQRR
jgi:hypothetical protein